jgi:hypothetical protein
MRALQTTYKHIGGRTIHSAAVSNVLECGGKEHPSRRPDFDTEAWPDYTGTVVRLEGRPVQVNRARHVRTQGLSEVRHEA